MDYFHEFFPSEAQREIIVHCVSSASALPEGYYAFLESYCSNPDCDCQEVLIQIELQSCNTPVNFERSAIPTVVLLYTWGKPFSKKNPTIHPEAPESSLAPDALKLFQEYVEANPSYLTSLNDHYSMMKKIEHCGAHQHNPLPIKREPKIGRNELCACGSGKKFKKCCMNK